MTNEQIKEAVEAAQKPLIERLDTLDKRMESIGRQRTIGFVTAALALIVAIAAIVYALNREAALDEQIDTNALVICSQARTTAAGYRQPLPDEGRRDFIERMVSQRLYLLASAGLECSKLPGFDTFPFLRARALQEIEEILRRLAPNRLRIGTTPAPGQVGGSAPSPAVAALPELPPQTLPGDSGGTGDPDPSGGHGDSTGGSGDPPKSHSPPGGTGGGGGGADEGAGGGGGGDEGGTGESPPPASGGAEEPPPPVTEEGGEEAGGQQSVLSPALDNTCNLPVVPKLLCTPR